MTNNQTIESLLPGNEIITRTGVRAKIISHSRGVTKIMTPDGVDYISSDAEYEVKGDEYYVRPV